MHFHRVPGRKAPIIAIVGADGSGKTTVSQEILNFMSCHRPTRLCHLGKQTGNLRRAMRQHSFGKSVDSRIRATGMSAREKGVSFPVALVIFTASMRRVFRFTKMFFFHCMGRAVLTDRYPQIAESSTQMAEFRVMDGPLLAGWRLTDVGAKMLMHLELWLYRKMTALRPDVVLRLNVDLETAVQRKPDHQASSLEKKIRVVPKLTFNGAPIVDLDSREPLEKVLEQSREVVGAIMDCYRNP